jgi:hypothetical protein
MYVSITQKVARGLSMLTKSSAKQSASPSIYFEIWDVYLAFLYFLTISLIYVQDYLYQYWYPIMYCKAGRQVSQLRWVTISESQLLNSICNLWTSYQGFNNNYLNVILFYRYFNRYSRSDPDPGQ